MPCDFSGVVEMSHNSLTSYGVLWPVGARVNAKDNKWLTPLHRAVASCSEVYTWSSHVPDNARIARCNFNLGEEPDGCYHVLQEAVQVLLKHSADVNARDKNWQTPLHIAAANKAVRCAEALVPLLSNVNVSDRAGRTALHHAAFSGHLEVIRSEKCWFISLWSAFRKCCHVYSFHLTAAMKHKA